MYISDDDWWNLNYVINKWREEYYTSDQVYQDGYNDGLKKAVELMNLWYRQKKGRS